VTILDFSTWGRDDGVSAHRFTGIISGRILSLSFTKGEGRTEREKARLTLVLQQPVFSPTSFTQCPSTPKGSKPIVGYCCAWLAKNSMFLLFWKLLYNTIPYGIYATIMGCDSDQSRHQRRSYVVKS
jgi:hypothetical protein